MRKSPDKFLMSMSMEIRLRTNPAPSKSNSGINRACVLRLISTENVDGTDAYKLELKDASGGIRFVFYDVESGLKIREEEVKETPEGPMVQSTIFGDYKDVDGILYPHKMVMNFGAQIITGTVDSVQFNSGIDNSAFR